MIRLSHPRARLTDLRIVQHYAGHMLSIAGPWMALLIVLGLMISGNASAQTYNIKTQNNTTVTSCVGTFYDSGGTSNYANNESYKITFTTGTSDRMRLVFSSLATESGYDLLKIYDGTSTSATLLGTWSGSTSPGTVTGSGSSLTVTFTSDNSVNGAGWVATLSCVATQDYGDYSSFTSASSTADSRIRLGAIVDTELTATTNATATGDDLTSTDDEDGVTVPGTITPGTSTSITVNVTNSIGATGYVNAWVDFNRNGVLTDAGEQIATNMTVGTGTTGLNQSITFTPPYTSVPGTAGVRVRITTTTNPGSTGSGTTGEVEDYTTTIASPTLDYGDYSGFGTASSTANSNLRIGSSVDAESTSNTNSTATGDDSTGSDDEDGVSVPVMVAGQSSTITATVSNSTGAAAYLNAWVDFNGNGVLTDAGEQVATNVSVATGTSNSARSITFTTPLAAMTNTGIGVRVRLSSTSTAGSTGASGTGEIEDHLTVIQPVCSPQYAYVGDSIDSSLGGGRIYRVNSFTGDFSPPSAFVTPNIAPLGAGWTIEGIAGFNDTMILSMSNNFASSGAILGFFQKSTGVYQHSFVTNISMFDLTTSLDGLYVYGVDGDNVRKFRITDGALMATLVLPSGGHWGVAVQPVTGDVFVTLGWTGGTTQVLRANAALSSYTLISGTQPASSGKGYAGMAFITPTEFCVMERNTQSAHETGDAKIRRYALTSLVSNTASLVATLQATAGDLPDGYDLSFAYDGRLLAASQDGSCLVSFNARTNAYSGVLVGPATAPATAKTLFIDCQETMSMLASVGNMVWNDANYNGIKDADESGIDGVTVTLNYDADANGNFNGAGETGYRTTTTSNGGQYSFGALGAGRYQVVVTPTSAYPLTGGSPVNLDNNIDNDNNGTQTVAGGALTGPIFTLDAMADDTTQDFALFSGLQIGNMAFNDANNNGVKDTGEAVISGLLVELLNGVSNGVMASTTTNGSGIYGFSSLVPGSYKIRVTPNSTYPLASSVVGTDNGTDNNNDGSQPGLINTASTSFAFDLDAASEPGTAGTGNNESTIDFGFRACPTINVTPATLSSATVGTAYSQGTAFSASGGVSPYTWSVSGVPAGMTWDAAALKLTGTPTSAGTSTVTLNVTDAKGCTGSRGISFTRSCPTIAVTPASAPNAVLNVNYNGIAGTQVSASGGNAPYAYTISGAPAWLTIVNSTGQLTGTPTALASNVSFTVNVTDNLGCTASKAYTINVISNTDFGDFATFGSASSVANSNLRMGATVDAEASATTNAAATGDDITGTDDEDGVTLPATITQGEAASITVNLTNNTGANAYLNAWIDYNKSGVLTDTGDQIATNVLIPTGTTNADQTINFTVPLSAALGTVGVRVRLTSVTNPGATGAIGTGEVEDYVITVACANITVAPSTLPNGTIGAAYTQASTFTATGGTGTYTYGATGVPAGMTFNTSTRKLTGTPTVSGLFNVPVTATDGNSCAGSVTVPFRICPIVTIAPTSLTNASVGSSYNQTTAFSASGGTAPYTWGTPGGVPAGMSWDGTNLKLTGTPTTAGSGNVTLTVTDANGCPGSLTVPFTRVCPTITVAPTSVPNALAGSTYNQATAFSATGGSGTVIFSASSLPAGMSFDSANKKFTGTPTAAGLYSVPVTATDSYSCAGSASVSIRVCPVITISPGSLSGGTTGISYSASLTASGGATPYTFSIATGSLPAGLSMNGSGAISGTPTTAGNSSFQALVTDANGCTAAAGYTVSISCPSITVSPTSAANGTLNLSYSQTLSASGGSPSYSWSTVSGTWPTGLSLSAGGVLSGTPTAPTSGVTGAAIVVKATDANNCASANTTINVKICPTLTISPVSLTVPVTGVAYSQTLTQSGSSATPLTWSASGLPAWLSLNSSTGVLSGTASATTSASFSVTVTDANGCSGSRSYTIAPVCPTITCTGSLPTTATQDSVYSAQTLTASGGTSPYTWSVIGSLPTGISLTSGVTATTAVVGGTPTVVQSSTFTIRATDANGCFKDTSYTIAVGCPVITITPASIGPFTQYTTISNITFQGAGGRTPYVWSISGLPTGLSLNTSTGVLSGRPTSNPGTYTITVNLTDNSGCAASASYNVTLSCPTVSVSTSTLPNGTAGTTYSATLAATTSGTSVPAQTYTWAVNPALPTGLSLSTAGVISGSPMVATSTTAYTFTATNQSGCSGSRALSFSTTCPTMTVTPTTLTDGLVGSAYSATMNVVGPGFEIQQAFSSTAIDTIAKVDAVLAGTNRISNYVGTSATVNFFGGGSGDGNFASGVAFPAGTGEEFALKATAIILIPTAGAWTFGTNSDDGLRLKIDGSTVINDDALHSNTDKFGTVTLTAGTHTLELVFMEHTGGEAVELFARQGTYSAYNTGFRLVGGSGGLTVYEPGVVWNANSGLPAGLSMNALGVISGTPTVATSGATGTVVSVTANNDNGCSVTQNVNLKICPVITLAPSSSQMPYYGQPYSNYVVPSGSAGAPFTFAVTSGSLPSWGSLNTATGEFSGTPNNFTASSFTITVTDSFGCTGTAAYTIAAVCPSLSISPTTLASAVRGSSYNQATAFTVSNGTAPFSFSASGLPSGMSFNTSTAKITGTPVVTGTYQVTVNVSDANGCTGSVVVTLSVTCPSMTIASPASMPDATAGVAYTQTITASGGTAPYSYSKSGGTLPPGLILSSGGALSGTPTTTGTYSFTVSASDSGSCVAAMSYTITVACPAITVSPSTLAYATVGSTYLQATAFSASSAGSGTFTWSAGSIPTGMSFDSSGRKFTGVPTTAGLFNATVTATDANSCPGSVTIPFRVCPVISISPSTLANGAVGTAYSQTLTASGGTASYSWAVTSGSLPTGMTLSAAGVLGGTPTVAVTNQAFTVTATDANGCPGVRAYTITTACPTITVTPAAAQLTDGLVGTSYSLSTIAASGGVSPYTWSLSGGTTLPTGLSLNTTTGAISGTPTAATTGVTGTAFTLQAADKNGCPVTKAYNIRVCPVITLSGSTPAGTINASYTTTLAASGGATPYTWSITSGTLQAGLTLNSSSGTISGTPTALGTASLTIRATDANGCAVSGAYSLTISCPTLSLSPTSIPQGLVGSAFTVTTASASSGRAPYTYTITSGTLPAGLTLTTAGVLSGTPTAATSGVNGTTVTMRAVDADTCNVSRSYNIKVCPVIVLTPGSPLGTGTTGTAYSATVSASGGATPYAWSVSSGTLPNGLSINASTGAITGTPTGSGLSNFTVQASDANACTSATAYAMRICPVITISPASLANATVGTAYSQATAFAASNGTAPYTWSVSGVPAGMTFDTGTLKLTGTPTSAGSGNITLNVTDANGCPGSIVVPFTRVCPTITVSPTSLSAADLSVVYTQTVSASGGTSAYSYSISAGALPTGLSLNASTGEISGTPTVAGTYNFTVRATDFYSCSNTRAYTVAVNAFGIGNLVWDDRNNNGIKDASETGLAGAQVELYKDDGDNVIDAPDVKTGSTVTTTSTGAYSFGNLVPGVYYVKVTPPATHATTGGTVVVLDNRVDNDNNGAQSGLGQPAYSPMITLSRGAEPVTDGDTDSNTDWTVDFGFWTGFTAGNLVWNDVNNDGLYQSASESGVSGLTVELMSRGTDNIAYNADDASVATTTTNASGLFGFQVYTAGSYYFKVTPNSTYPVIGLNRVATDTGIDNDNNANTQPALISTPINGSVFTLAAGTEPGSSGSTNIDNTIDVAVRACPTMTITPTSLANATVGVPYSQASAFSISGGFAPYTWSASGVPAGMTFDTGTLKLTGTPTSAGSGNVTISVVDVYGCTGSVVVPFSRICPTITVTPTTLAYATVGSSYAQSTAFTAASVGNQSFAYSAVGIPPGMSFDATGRILTGTPITDGLYSVVTTAQDANSCQGSVIVPLRVCPVIDIAPTTLPDANVGLGYNQTVAFSTSAGAAPLTWTVTGLPPGLSFSSTTRTISGVPTNLGTAIVTFPISVSVVDANGCPGSRTVNLRVIPAMRVGSLVWYDVDDDGLRDAGEPGMAGIAVQLWNAGPNGVVEEGSGDDVKIGADITTDSNGSYQFINVPPASGYYVRLPTLPPTRGVPAANAVASDNGVDNDNNALQPGGPGTPVRSPAFTLSVEGEPAAGVDGDDINGDNTIDLGLALTVCVGNLVFRDVDNSGHYNSDTDLPIDGVQLKLFNQGIDPLFGTAVATTVSANGGLYQFNVRQGNYFVYVPPGQFQAGGVLENLKPTRGRTDQLVPPLDDDVDQNALVTAKPMALGVKTGNFTLATGTLPDASAGETGHNAASDATYETDANLTVDLGFYPIPEAGAPLAGRVRRDLTGAGDPEAATAPQSGVEVVLYEDANQNGIVDDDEQAAIDLALTDASGNYSFDAVAPGTYIVAQTVLPGAEATFDTDGGNAEKTSVTMDGTEQSGIDFMQTAVEDTFHQWQAKHALEGGNAAGDDPDGDGYPNLLEYALDMAADSAVRAAPRFYLEAQAGVINALLKRPAQGHLDVSFVLERSADLVRWNRVDAAPEAVSGTGDTLWRYRDVGQGDAGYFRVRVDLDADHNGDAEAEATTPVYGYGVQHLPVGQTTLSTPLVLDAVFAGAIANVDGSGAVIARGQGLTAALKAGRRYQAEIAGLIYEVDAAQTTDARVALKSAPPASVAGERLIIRPCWTLRELLPVASLHATSSAATADRVMFFENGQYKVHWLVAAQQGSRWVADASLADTGGRALARNEGMVVHLRSSPADVVLTGQVNPAVLKLAVAASETRLMGSGSLAALNPTVAAGDRVRLLSSDGAPGAVGFIDYRFTGTAWVRESDGSPLGATDKLALPFRSYFWVKGVQ